LEVQINAAALHNSVEEVKTLLWRAAMFDVIKGARQTGKTTILIDRAAETGEQIVVADAKRAAFVKLLAKQYGKEIKEPISVETFLRMRQYRTFRSAEKIDVLIDDVEAVLWRIFQPCEIKAVTLTDWSGSAHG